jgi:hypothetical protein
MQPWREISRICRASEKFCQGVFNHVEDASLRSMRHRSGEVLLIAADYRGDFNPQRSAWRRGQNVIEITIQAP